jgi:hypothetical protein
MDDYAAHGAEMIRIETLKTAGSCLPAADPIPR